MQKILLIIACIALLFGCSEQPTSSTGTDDYIISGLPTIHMTLQPPPCTDPIARLMPIKASVHNVLLPDVVVSFYDIVSGQNAFPCILVDTNGICTACSPCGTLCYGILSQKGWNAPESLQYEDAYELSKTDVDILAISLLHSFNE